MEDAHLFYLQVIVSYIKETYSDNKFYWMSDLKEHENVPMTPIPNPKKPPPVLIKKPDLIAEERDNLGIFIIGEAKTYSDFLTGHERKNSQLDYYLNYLKNKPSGMLIYSLPHSLKNQATILINQKKEEWKLPEIKFKVITDLDHTMRNI
jgi:hypothetical protein